MKNISVNKKILTLSAILFVLIFLFCISFVSQKKNSKSYSIDSALLNTKYNISKINIFSKNTGELFFYNLKDFWGGEFSDYENDIYFPCNTQAINDFLVIAKKIVPLNTVIASKNNKDVKKNYEHYGLDDNSAVVVSFFDETDNCVSKIFFGSLNSSGDKVFIRTLKNETIYSIPAKITDYLSLEIKSWIDQNIIPEGLLNRTKETSIQNFLYSFNGNTFINAPEKASAKFPSFRFSELLTDFDIDEKSLELKLYDGKGSEYHFSFYPARTTSGNCYAVKTEIIPSSLLQEEQKDFIKRLDYFTGISEWTYNSIIQLLQ